VQEINSSRYNRTQQNIEARRPLRVTRKQAIRTIIFEDGAAICGKWGWDHSVSQHRHENLTLTISRSRQIDGVQLAKSGIDKPVFEFVGQGLDGGRLADARGSPEQNGLGLPRFDVGVQELNRLH